MLIGGVHLRVVFKKSGTRAPNNLDVVGEAKATRSETVAAISDCKMSGCDDGATTPDLSDAEICGSMAGPPGTIEGSEG